MSANVDTVMQQQPTVTVAGVIVPHNTKQWRVATNRHRTTSGYSWGWIEGAPGNICWSNDGAFKDSHASELVRLHNQWLEDQKPLSIRLIEARQRLVAAKKAYDETKSRFDSAAEALGKCDAELIELANRQGAGQ